MINIVLGLIIGFTVVVVWWAVWYFLIVPQKKKSMQDEARKEAEVIKQKKMLEVKEKFLSKKNELDKEVQQRNQQLHQP